MRSRGLWGGCWLTFCLAFSLVASSCGDEDDCDDTCDQLDACGLLPSTLGTDAPGCKDRCSRSTDANQKRVAECTADGDRASWCELSDGNGEPRCVTTARCLVGAFGSKAVLGTGEVRFDATALCSDTWSDALSPVQGLSCDETERCTTGTVSDALCGSLGVTEIEFLVTNVLGETHSTTRPCSSALTTGATIAEVASGAAVARVRIRGSASPGGEGGGLGQPRPFCRVFYPASYVIVKPNARVAVSPIALGSRLTSGALDGGFPCEEGPELCTDGIDNDNNGRQDGDELPCQSYAAESP